MPATRRCRAAGPRTGRTGRPATRCGARDASSMPPVPAPLRRGRSWDCPFAAAPGDRAAVLAADELQRYDVRHGVVGNERGAGDIPDGAALLRGRDRHRDTPRLEGRMDETALWPVTS